MEDKFIIRDAVKEDIQDLAALHVKAWNETYNNTSPDPSVATRKWQWEEIFSKQDGSWFCLVIETTNKALIGFAKGQVYHHADLPDFNGELNKIYILKAYQQSGLGKMLLAKVFDRFKTMGIESVVLFGDANNPSGGFHEKMGAKKLYTASGEFHGGYGWINLSELPDALLIIKK